MGSTSVEAVAVTYDPGEIALDLSKEFRSRWARKIDDEHTLRRLGGLADSPIRLSRREYAVAQTVAAPGKLDRWGASVSSLSCTHHEVGIAAVEAIMSSGDAWTGFSIPGFVKHKESGITTVSKARGLLPQPAVAQVAHEVTKNRIVPYLDAYSRKGRCASS